jgi:hypothetical protein
MTLPCHTLAYGTLSLFLTLATGHLQAQEVKKATKRIDAATIAAYEKLGARYGGLVEDRGTVFRWGQAAADEGIPAFSFGTEPRSNLPDANLPFGLQLRDMSDAGMKKLAGLKHLSVLYLTGSDVTEMGLKELAGLGNLTTISLSRDQLTDGALRTLREIGLLHTLSRAWAKDKPRPKNAEDVFKIFLYGTPITDSALKELAVLSNLDGLFIGETNVTDAGLKQMPGFKLLTRLDLQDTKVTDAGLKELVRLPALAGLELSQTKVTDAGLKELARLKNLTKLYVFHTSVTEEGAAELRKALPRCEIFR